MEEWSAHSLLLALCLWMRRARDDHNHHMLTQQRGWQLHVCNMLNGSGGPDRTSHALCLQLLSEHLVACLQCTHASDEPWAEVRGPLTAIGAPLGHALVTPWSPPGHHMVPTCMVPTCSPIGHLTWSPPGPH